MCESEMLKMLDLETLNTAGVYALPTQYGHVDGSQGYSWERERYFMLSPFGVQLITCFRHCGDGEGCFEVADWSIN